MNDIQFEEYIRTELTNKIKMTEVILRAYYELMLESGITADEINQKIDEIISRKVKGDYNRFIRKNCPRCGSIVTESYTQPYRGMCAKCGTKVMFYPFDDGKEETKETDPLAGLEF